MNFPLGRGNSRSNSAGPVSSTPTKWYLLGLIEDLRQPLGLRGTSIAILRAMLSFLPKDQIMACTDDGHICFASNVALAERAHVSIQTVERHIAKLVNLGIITRRSSGNGKRWARRDRHGRVTLATGLSLLPLLARRAEFETQKDTYVAQQDRLTLLADKCRIALAHLGEAIEDSTLLEKAKRILRRKPQNDILEELLSEITIYAAQHETNTVTPKLMDTAHQRTCDKDTNMNRSNSSETVELENLTPQQMERAFPRLCAELRHARTIRDCEEILHNISEQLVLGQTTFSLQRIGPTKRFMILGYVLERIERIKSPKRYINQLLRRESAPNFQWESLLSPVPSKIRHA